MLFFRRSVRLNSARFFLLESQSTWLQQLSIDINSTILEIQPTPNLSISLYKSLEQYSTSTILHTIFKVLLDNIRPTTSLNSAIPMEENQINRILKLRRIGRTLIGINSRIENDDEQKKKKKNRRKFNLLDSGSTKDYLISYAQELNSIAISNSHRGINDQEEGRLEIVKIELILSIWEDCFFAAEFMERELSLGEVNGSTAAEGAGGECGGRIDKLRKELRESFLKLKSTFETKGGGAKINVDLFVEGILNRVACASVTATDVEMGTE